jgi:glycosyltransferase involved in cell wall biosynthesis
MYYKKNSIIKVCLITPGHLSTNPRLIKEADALIGAGFEVHVIFTQYMKYLLNDDALLLSKYPNLTYNKLNWVGKNNKYRISCGIVQKFCKGLAKLFRNNISLHKFILNRHYLWQYKKAIIAKADFYIAHNSGAIAIAADAAKKNNVRFGFDAEDFHRGEGISNTELTSLIHIENHYIPLASHLTAASDLIGDEYEKIYHKKFIAILNVFPKQEPNDKKKLKNAALQLFWFSQTVGSERGIENTINALNISKNEFEFHLLGDVTLSYKKYLYNLASTKKKCLFFHKPVAPDEVFEIANKFDIGLATENITPYNRNICLTNKIFTYIQSGLAVIATSTLAQTSLIKKYPDIGTIFDQNDVHQLANLLDKYYDNRELLAKHKKAAFDLGQNELNWEIESKKFLQIIEKILND